MTPQTKPETNPRNWKEFLATMRERFTYAEESEREIRKSAVEDLEFLTGEQWDPKVRLLREKKDKPCLTIDHLTPMINQMTNQQRQARQAIQVNPVGDGADQDTAEIRQGLMRHIEVVSHADTAFDHAYDMAAKCSMGVLGVSKIFIPGSLQQELRIDRILDPMCVYFDPDAEEPDKSDGNFAFKVRRMSHALYKQKYKKTAVEAADFYRSGTNPAPDWITGSEICVAEYWYVETETRTMLGLSKPIRNLAGKMVTSGYEDELPDPLPAGVDVVITREEDVRNASQIITNGIEALEDESDWGGTYIPLIPVYGAEMVVKGKRHIFSMIRNSHDAQRFYNYQRSETAVAFGTAPDAPWLGPAGSFNTNTDWSNPKGAAYLEYNPVTVGGQPAGPPVRNLAEPPIQALNEGATIAEHDIQTTTNIFPQSLGEREGDESGKAILARQNQSNNANYHLQANLDRARWHVARILNEQIPVVYDADQVIRIIKPDNSHELVRINSDFDHQNRLLLDKKGKPRPYDMTTGRYDVTISTGASYESRRQAAVDSMLALAKTMPQLVPQFAYLIVKDMDWPNAQAVADAITPPAVKEQQEQAENGGAPSPEAMQQIAAQHQKLVQELQQATEFIKTKGWQENARIQIVQIQESNKRYIAQIGNLTQLAIEQAKIGNSAASDRLWAEIDTIKHAWDKQIEAQQFAHQQDQDQQASDLAATAQASAAAQPAAQPQPGAAQ